MCVKKLSCIFSAAFAIAGVGFSSCQNKEDMTRDVFKQIHFDLESSSQVKLLSEICDSVSLIQLETNDKSVIGIVDKLLVDSSNIYVLSSNQLFVYDVKGHYKFVISHLGHAINEYIEINDFCISEKRIFLADSQSKKILVFSKDGVYEKTIETTMFPEHIESLNNRKIAISASGAEGKRLTLLDVEDEDNLQSYFQNERRFSSPIPQVFIRSSDNQLYYKQPFSNVYFRILENGDIEEAYLLDFGKYNFKLSDLDVMNIGGCRILYDTKGNVNILRFNESSDMYEVEFECNRISEEGQFIMLANKDSERTFMINSDSYKDDLTYADYRIVPDFSLLYNDNFWGVIYPASWRQSFAEIKDKPHSIQYENIAKIISKVSDEQNPIICVYHVKPTL